MLRRIALTLAALMGVLALGTAAVSVSVAVDDHGSSQAGRPGVPRS